MMFLCRFIDNILYPQYSIKIPDIYFKCKIFCKEKNYQNDLV